MGVGEVEVLDCGDVGDKVLTQELLLGTPDAIFSLIQESILVRVTMFLISASGEVEEANGIGLMTRGGAQVLQLRGRIEGQEARVSPP